MELDMDIKDGCSATAVADARQEPYRPLWQERTALLLGEDALGRQAWAEWEHTPQR